MTTPTITVDIDKTCMKCGGKGVPCFKCAAASLKKVITAEILQEIAADIEKLLLEKQEQIEWAFKRVPDGFKISIGINLDHTIPPTAEYSVSFPMEPAHEPILKEKVTLKKVIGQGEIDLK